MGTKRPYKLTETVATGPLNSVQDVHLGSYASLTNAIAAAQRLYPGLGPVEIVLHGSIIRSVYTHGHVSTWTTGLCPNCGDGPNARPTGHAGDCVSRGRATVLGGAAG